MDNFKMQQEQQRKCNKLELILSEESDRGAAILGASYIEERLREMLLNFMIQSDESEKLLNRQLSTFDSRISLAFGLGLINRDEYLSLDLLRKIRNEFAHNFNEELSFDDSNVASKCGNLLFDDHFWVSGKEVKTNRDKFICSTFILGRSLLFRVSPDERLEQRE